MVTSKAEPTAVEAPVVDPNKTPQNIAGLVAAITPIVLWLAARFGVPLTADGLTAIFGGLSIAAGIFMWAKNRWYDASVTSTSAQLHNLKVLRRS